MSLKKRPNIHILDRLHKGFVIACIGVTAYGTYLLGWRVHRYFTVIQPAKKEHELRMIKEKDDSAPVLRT